MQKKVGILTWHQYYNFGSMLQAYALQTALGKLGIDNEIINYFDPQTFSPPSSTDNLKYLIKKVCSCIGLRKVLPDYFSFERFYHEKLRKSKVVADDAGLKQLSQNYRCIVFGSDQIWAPNVYNPVYMGSFADRDSVKLISYAASIGLNDIPEALRSTYRSLLLEFSQIAVREEKGKNLLKECCGLDARVVLDPTLLIEAKEYRKLQKPVYQVNKPYIFCYFLNKNHQYRERVEAYSKKTGYEIYGVSVSEQDGEWMHLLPATGPEEFLWLVDHAETVFTDSYHGTIFSIQFHKAFWTFERFAKRDPICQNSRIQQLKDTLGIGARILGPEEVWDEKSMLDYNQIDYKLQMNREKSMGYLREALH